MATFFTDLWNSIFTPGPTPSIMLATNVSFLSLQVLLFALLVATYSVHFAVLSFLCASLWWAINWFVRELEAANAKESTAGQLREVRLRRTKDEKMKQQQQQRREKRSEDEINSDTETEGVAADAGGSIVGRAGTDNRKDKRREEEDEDEEGVGESHEVDSAGFLSPDVTGTSTNGSDASGLRKRMSVGEASSAGDLSTDSEWDKMDEVGEIDKQ